MSSAGEAMEIDDPSPERGADENEEEDDEEEEDIGELQRALNEASKLSSEGSSTDASKVLSNMLQDTEKVGPKAIQVKERAVYDLTRSYCASKQYNAVADFLTGNTGKIFLSQITKAKTAKVVRQVIVSHRLKSLTIPTVFMFRFCVCVLELFRIILLILFSSLLGSGYCL